MLKTHDASHVATAEGCGQCPRYNTLPEAHRQAGDLLPQVLRPHRREAAAVGRRSLYHQAGCLDVDTGIDLQGDDTRILLPFPALRHHRQDLLVADIAGSGHVPPHAEPRIQDPPHHEPLCRAAGTYAAPFRRHSQATDGLRAHGVDQYVHHQPDETDAAHPRHPGKGCRRQHDCRNGGYARRRPAAPARRPDVLRPYSFRIGDAVGRSAEEITAPPQPCIDTLKNRKSRPAMVSAFGLGDNENITWRHQYGHCVLMNFSQSS